METNSDVNISHSLILHFPCSRVVLRREAASSAFFPVPRSSCDGPGLGVYGQTENTPQTSPGPGSLEPLGFRGFRVEE